MVEVEGSSTHHLPRFVDEAHNCPKFVLVCSDEHHQSYAQRFLCLRSQAPSVSDDIVIEAMVKGLYPNLANAIFCKEDTPFSKEASI